MSSMLDRDNDRVYSTHYSVKPGFHLGFSLDKSLSDQLSIKYGLLFTTKGVFLEYNLEGRELKGKVNINFLEVPLTLKVSTSWGQNRLFGRFGAYTALAVGGKLTSVAELQGKTVTVEEKIKFGTNRDFDLLRRRDAGLTFGGGVEVGNLTTEILYDLGLSNNYSSHRYGNTNKNRVLRVSVGYILKKQSNTRS